MKTLNVELEHCYGIKKLTFTFDFTGNSTYAIYAGNGMMKTSFAKTFQDLSAGQMTTDSIFKQRKTKRIICEENNKEVTKEEVFVVLPYNKDYKSNKLSTLLVNKGLREQYELIHRNIDEKKELLIKELRNLSGLKSYIEETLSTDISFEPKKFFESIRRLEKEVLNKSEAKFDNIVYQKIFNEKVVNFLETKDFKLKLSDYIEKYNELLESSTYFKKGIFNHNNASTIAKNLKDNGFFKAKHTVSLTGKKANRVIATEEELEQVIQEEKDNILKDPGLVKAFEEIDKAITKNQELKDFRVYLENNLSILPELRNPGALRQSLWISYLKRNIEAYKDLEHEYSNGEKEIEKIVAQAKKEETQWRKIISEFNRRFFVPFEVSVTNQEDVILMSEAPSIKFEFKDESDKVTMEEEELIRVLSNGELRALYLLNIIFEVEARKENKQETLFVIDDIADSFDYKNKYAIIEYLKDISGESIFHQVILTHNFDFYRTVSGRLGLNRESKLNVVKTGGGIQFVEEKYQNNPFEHWKKEFDKAGNESMLIASIPFVRNIAEFSGDVPNALKLTSLLHIKENTMNIEVDDLEGIFKEILKDKKALKLIDGKRKVVEVIYKSADDISRDATEIIDLEKKIVLAIGIRLKAERFMISKIKDDVFWRGIKSNQTLKLIDRYRKDYSGETKNIRLLEEVNLMTPENIHLNSFMYEPILDMSNEHLKRLYLAVSEISNNGR